MKGPISPTGSCATNISNLNDADFYKNATDPLAWFLKAWMLRSSANKIFETSLAGREENHVRRAFLFDSASLLYGYATETALKGHLLWMDPSNVQIAVVASGDGSIQDVELKILKGKVGKGGHDLLALAELGGFLKDEDGSDKLKKHLQYLTSVIVWAGKYPVPLKSNDYAKPTIFVSSQGVIKKLLKKILGPDTISYNKAEGTYMIETPEKYNQPSKK